MQNQPLTIYINLHLQPEAMEPTKYYKVQVGWKESQ